MELTGQEMDWNIFSESLLSAYSKRFDKMNAAIGHIKLMLTADDSYILGNLTGTQDTLSLRGNTNIGKQAILTLNARVQLPPDQLEAIIMEEIQSACQNQIQVHHLELNCLSPGRPHPTHRYNHIV